MNAPKAIITAKSKDYLMGYISAVIETKNKVAKEAEIEVPSTTLMDGTIFDVHCTCGKNYIAFKSWDHVPEKSLKCDFCPMYLIFYLDELEVQHE